MSEQPLYERLGGIYSIAAVVDHFAKTLAEDPVAGKNTSNPFSRIGMQTKVGESQVLSF